MLISANSPSWHPLYDFPPLVIEVGSGPNDTSRVCLYALASLIVVDQRHYEEVNLLLTSQRAGKNNCQDNRLHNKPLHTVTLQQTMDLEYRCGEEWHLNLLYRLMPTQNGCYHPYSSPDLDLDVCIGRDH